MRGGSITVGGVSAFGMQVVVANSVVDLDDVPVRVTASAGAAATGILANNIAGASVVNAKNSNIIVSGTTATGASATGANTQVNLDNVSILVNGTTSGAGVRAINGGKLTISNGSSSITNGSVNYGIFLDTASLGIVSDTTVITTGNLALELIFKVPLRSI